MMLKLHSSNIEQDKNRFKIYWYFAYTDKFWRAVFEAGKKKKH